MSAFSQTSQPPSSDGVLLEDSPGAATFPPASAPVQAGLPAVAPRKWVRRRVVAAVAILAAVAIAVHANVGWALAEHPIWSVTTAGVLVLSSLTLALFVPAPGSGWRPVVGCAPCAAVGAILAVVAPWMAVSNAFDTSSAGFGLALAAMAFTRKVTETSTCR
nr:hypothetical protein [Actinomycetales bacterium]